MLFGLLNAHGDRCCYRMCKCRREDPVHLTSDIVTEKLLILPKEESAFDGQDMPKHWWVPINWACKLVQMNLPMMKDAKEVIGQLNKFQGSLQKILEYHENPLPALCAQAVHIMAWGYLISSAVVDQQCEGKHHPAWIPLLVS